MTPTNIGALLGVFDGLVRDLVPSSEAHRERRWRLVDDRDRVASSEIRTFFIEATEPTPVTSGIYGPSAIEHETTIRVFTSYANIRPRLKQTLAGEDARQIWIDWDIRRDPIVDGLVSVENSGWEPEDEEQATQWGAHTFEVRFIAEGVPT